MKNLFSCPTAFFVLTIAWLFQSQTLLIAQIDQTESEYLPNEVLVMLETGVSGEKFFSALRTELNFELLSVPSPSAGIYHLGVASSEWEQSLTLLRAKRQVRAVQLNHLVSERETVPNDPNYGQQWHHDEPANLAFLQATNAVFDRRGGQF